MEINIDLYKVGYLVGRYGTRALLYFTTAKTAISGYSRMDSLASKHSINSSNIEAVKDNLLECLEYIDW